MVPITPLRLVPIQRYRQLSNDESYLGKAARYLKKLAQAKRDVENAKAKEEALASINQAFTELKLHREGKMDFIPAEDLLNEL